MKKKITVIAIAFIYINFVTAQSPKNEFLSCFDTKDKWLPVEFLEIMKYENREKIKEYQPEIESMSDYVDYLDEWKDWYSKELFMFEDIKIRRYLDQDTVWLPWEWSFFILSVKKDKNTYFVGLQQTDSSIFYNEDYERISRIIKTITNLSNLRSIDGRIEAKFVFEGDYLVVYANSGRFSQKYFKCDISTFEQLQSLIYNNKIDLSHVTWPRHADGTCDYEVSATKPSIAVGTILRAADNLRLRSSEATSSAVITTMQKGTRVKILALGKQQTIDGITSNWVQVEILPGAKDRDGKPIKAGTSGWCFGGYLLQN